MTPSEIVEYARQQYNSVSDDFFTDDELYRHIWAAQMELARKAMVIERVYTTSTVASQQEYEFPTNTIAIKRITYDGKKLKPVTFREDDCLTLGNSASAATGTPQYYAVWNETLYLRPVPATVATLKIFSYNEPQEVSNTSTIEVPSMFHLDIADYLVWRKALKDKNFQAAQNYKMVWDQKVQDAKLWQRRAKRGDSFTAVQDQELLQTTIIGAV